MCIVRKISVFFGSFPTKTYQIITHICIDRKKIRVREDIKTKNTFQFGHCPNYPTPHPPIRATLPTLSGRQKRRFARMAEKNTDDDNNCCHDNFDQNFGNFDDNDDKKY